VAIAFYTELPGMSSEQSDAVLRDLNLNGRSPEGQLFHAEGPLESGGTWVMDAWVSAEALQTFIEQKLAPIMQRFGMTPPQPTLHPLTVLLTPERLSRF
jgi:hypothetical protein